MEADFDGWPMHLSTSPNKRTLYNFPMQSGGASMLRLATVRLCEADLVPSMLVHDGILLELQNQEQVEQAHAIMQASGTEVCRGLVIDVETEFDTPQAWRPLHRQAAGRDLHVAYGDGRAAGDWRAAEGWWCVMVDDSYTYRNGKFVKRTAEQQRRRDEYFAAAAESKKPQRVPRRKESFIQITIETTRSVNTASVEVG